MKSLLTYPIRTTTSEQLFIPSTRSFTQSKAIFQGQPITLIRLRQSHFPRVDFQLTDLPPRPPPWLGTCLMLKKAVLLLFSRQCTCQLLSFKRFSFILIVQEEEEEASPAPVMGPMDLYESGAVRRSHRGIAMKFGKIAKKGKGHLRCEQTATVLLLCRVWWFLCNHQRERMKNGWALLVSYPPGSSRDYQRLKDSESCKPSMCFVSEDILKSTLFTEPGPGGPTWTQRKVVNSVYIYMSKPGNYAEVSKVYVAKSC